MTPRPRGRVLGWSLIGLAVVFLLLTLGLAFTIFGEIAALLAVACLVAGLTVLVRGQRPR